MAPHLLRFAFRNTNDMDMAKDIVQDAFEVLWKSKENVQSAKVKQYLFTVVFRKGIDMFRSNKDNIRLEEISQNQTVDLEPDNGLNHKDLLFKALQFLSEDYRKLILLKDLEGYNYKEIELISGFSESQVKVYLFRARKMLKEIVLKLETT